MTVVPVPFTNCRLPGMELDSSVTVTGVETPVLLHWAKHCISGIEEKMTIAAMLQLNAVKIRLCFLDIFFYSSVKITIIPTLGLAPTTVAPLLLREIHSLVPRKTMGCPNMAASNANT